MTNKLEKLTLAQESLMLQVKQEWLDKLFKPPYDLNFPKLIQDTHWLYEFCKLEKPLVLIADSPYAAQLMANLIKLEWPKFSDQVGDQVGDQVWGQVWGQVGDQVGGQVRGQVRGQKLEYFTWAMYGDVNDYGWNSFYDFFDRIGLINLPEFHKFKALLENDIFLSIQLKGFCIYSRKPIRILRDKENNLHSEYQSAIAWKDDYELYYLHGVCFTKEEHHKITSRTMTFAEINKIDNSDKKAIAMKFCKRDSFIIETKAELLDGKTWKGNSLYKIPESAGVFDRDEYFIAYDCPSSGREYFEAVSPEDAKRLKYKADACLAARHHFSVEEYYSKAFVSA